MAAVHKSNHLSQQIRRRVCQLFLTGKDGPYIGSWVPTSRCLPGRNESTCTWNCVWWWLGKLYSSLADKSWKDVKHPPTGEQVNQCCGTHRCNRKLLTNTKELTLTLSSNTGVLETLGKEPAEGATVWVHLSRHSKWTWNGAGTEKGRVCEAWRNSQRQQGTLLWLWMFSVNAILYTSFSVYKIANHSPGKM